MSRFRVTLCGLLCAPAFAAAAASGPASMEATTVVSVQFGAAGFCSPAVETRLAWAGIRMHDRDWLAPQAAESSQLFDRGFSLSNIITSLGFVGAVYGMKELGSSGDATSAPEPSGSAAAAGDDSGTTAGNGGTTGGVVTAPPIPDVTCKKDCGQGQGHGDDGKGKDDDKKDDDG